MDNQSNRDTPATKYDEGVFAIVVETRDQAPILWEAEACNTSYNAVRERYEDWKRRPHVVRIAMVRISYEQGHEGLLPSMKGYQK